MAILKNLLIREKNSQFGSVPFTDDLCCTKLEEYRNTPLCSGNFNFQVDNEMQRRNSTFTGATLQTSGNRAAGYFSNDLEIGDIITTTVGNNFVLFASSGNALNSPSSLVPRPSITTNYRSSIVGTFSTNVPIFETYQEAFDYVTAQTDEQALQLIESAVNFKASAYTNETQDYYIFNTYDTCDIELGIVKYTGGDPVGRFEIFKANAEPCLYFVDEDNSCELGLLFSEVVGSVYSSINKQAVIDAQFDPDLWTVGSLVYESPFYHPLTYLPDGSYTIGVTFDTNIYIAHNRQQAEDYLSGRVPPEDLYNYGSVGNPQIASNETGTKELITTFGGNESENVFSHDYMMSHSELATIGGKFFDTNILNALLDGLKLYGNANPMESVLGCLYFPFDLSTVCPDYTAVTDIYFGSYKMENVSANKIKHRSGYKEMGSTFIKPTFYNWLDYKAMHVYLYLAYIGFVELDVNKYLNKTLKIIYMVDIHSGECEVSLLADGLLMDTYSGQIGIKQPITYNDLSTYFQSQITALRNGVMSFVGGPVAGAGTGAQIGSSGGPYGMLAGAVTGASLGQMVGNANVMWQGWKVSHTKPPLFSKGGYSSEIGANMPQYCFLVFMYNDVEIPANLLSVYGKPSNKSGNVGSFSGFLSTNYVKLQCPTATEEEQAEIVSLLNSGIYI